MHNILWNQNCESIQFYIFFILLAQWCHFDGRRTICKGFYRFTNKDKRYNTCQKTGSTFTSSTKANGNGLGRCELDAFGNQIW